ncbi:MAG: SsrA-binding protein SmpB [Acidobacteria bacterium]|jgi:SsrA-binding protein|nr:SsrA-binding protein SmpB [Acidobacteriota bacterium]MBK9708897.1 SsrA-binding protein SmpB [Acidobacteriota bacterium]
MAEKNDAIKVITTNREAYFNYHILETYETGIQLTGTEVKSARAGRVNLKDAYATIQDGEAWLLNAHISQYTHGNRQNHDPIRDRRLLLHKKEIIRLKSKVQEKGLTLVPTKLYFKGNLIKCEIAIAKGKKFYDKRETEARKTQEREARAAMKHRSREE